MENKHYIYFHINPLKNEIFYVGKGTIKYRAYSKHSRNKLWHSIVNKYGYIIDVVESRLTEQEAFEREKFYIKKIGRRDLGLGPLVNMTDGGEGMSGISPWNKGLKNIYSEEYKKKISDGNKRKKISEETKKKISESKKGKAPRKKGFKHSDETKKKMSESGKGKIISKETREKIRQINLGKKLSEETKNKIRKSHIDRNQYL